MKKLIVFLFMIISISVLAQDPVPVPGGNWYDFLKPFITVESITGLLIGIFGDRLLIRYRAGKLKETFTAVDAALEDNKVSETEYRQIWAIFKEVFKKRV